MHTCVLSLPGVAETRLSQSQAAVLRRFKEAARSDQTGRVVTRRAAGNAARVTLTCGKGLPRERGLHCSVGADRLACDLLTFFRKSWQCRDR